MDIEQEIADEISGIQVGSGYYSTTIGIDAAQEAAAALMPLVRRAQAEALRDAAREYGPAQISGFFLGPEGYTKAWLDDRADRIEQNSEGNET